MPTFYPSLHMDRKPLCTGMSQGLLEMSFRKSKIDLM